MQFMGIIPVYTEYDTKPLNTKGIIPIGKELVHIVTAQL